MRVARSRSVYRSNSQHLTSVALLVALTGCAGVSKIGEVPDLTAGKTDGSLQLQARGALGLADEQTGHLTLERAEQWTFELNDTAVVTIEAGGVDIDTILYLHDDGGELAVDDDGGEGVSSSLNILLGAGRYQVTVTLYDGSPEGDYTLRMRCEGAGCDASLADPWALARDVNRTHVEFTDSTPIPDSYARPVGTTPVGLSSPEWWQRWPGGATQSFRWGEGSAFGQRCAQAAAIRLEAIMAYETVGEDGVIHRPGATAFAQLVDDSAWSGSMYNAVEDVSDGGTSDFGAATMWAWRTETVKFVNVVHPDGSCDLPTLALVEQFSETCLIQAELEDGSIEGCRVSAE